MVGILAASVVTQSEPDVSADMLLIRARLERMRAAGDVPGDRDRGQPDDDELLIADEDMILYPAQAPIASGADAHVVPASSFTLVRPLAGVSLASLAWSGAIDHAVLQDAIGCAPVSADPRLASLLRYASDRPFSGAVRGEPALCVGLSLTEIDFLGRALERADAAARRRLADAALLPDSLSDAPSAATAAAAHSLLGYRSVALVAAWREVMGLPSTAESARELDAAAARLLSTMRAFLGET